MNGMRTLRTVCLVALVPGSIWATTPVNLGTAYSFAVLAGSTITNTGPTILYGDLGLSPGTAVTGFPPGLVIGAQYIADPVALQAKVDLVTAYDDAAGRGPSTTIPPELGGSVLVPGVYNSATGAFGITGTLTLDALNDANAVFVFQMESTLITATGSDVVFVNRAQACNVYWQVGSSATLGTNSNFLGTILALTSISLTTGATMEGRVLARNGAVTFDSNLVTMAICEETVGADDVPTSMELAPAYPNPFNPSTTIEFTLEQTDQVRLLVHNMRGQQVAVLVDGLVARGNHVVDFQAANLPSGIYTYTLMAGDVQRTKSFTLLK